MAAWQFGRQLARVEARRVVLGRARGRRLVIRGLAGFSAVLVGVPLLALGVNIGAAAASVAGRVTIYPSISAPYQIATGPDGGPAGTAVTITGKGFGSGEQVTVKFVTGLASPASVLLCTATAAADGKFSCPATVPTTADAGARTIKAKGHTSGTKAKTVFLLTT